MPNSITQSRSTALISAGLITTAIAALVWRLTTVVEPLGIDQSLWASAVRGMSRGQLLYRDVWEQRPPGIYFTYLWSLSLFGWKASTIAWLDLAATAVTTGLLYVIAKRLASPITAALAAAMYAALTMPSWLYRNGGILERSVCETFIIVCVASAVVCADGIRRRGSFGTAFGFGVWMGAAALYKPNAALYFPALLFWSFIAAEAAVPSTTKFRARVFGIATAGAAVLPIVALLWLWRHDLIGDARTAVLDFNRWYVSRGFTLHGYSVLLMKALDYRLRQYPDPLWLCGAAGAVVAVWRLVSERRVPPLVSLTICWGAASAAVIAVNGMWLFNTYFMNPLPPLTLLGAWWLTGAARDSRAWRVLAVATMLATAWFLSQRNYWTKITEVAAIDVQYMRGQLDRSSYLERFGGYNNERGFSARGNEEMSLYVRDHTAPDDEIYLFGINGAGVYFLSDRLTANRFLRANFFVPDGGFPDPRFTLGAVVEELRAKRPAYLIFEQLHSGSEMGVAVDALQEHPLVRSLLEDYARETRIEDFTLYRRK